ncbi:MAG TPA: hypothetical protein VIJ70_09655 [Gaiellaceae bacterium]
MSQHAAIILNTVIGLMLVGSLIWLLAHPGIAHGAKQERHLLRHRFHLQRHTKNDADRAVL